MRAGSTMPIRKKSTRNLLSAAQSSSASRALLDSERGSLDSEALKIGKSGESEDENTYKAASAGVQSVPSMPLVTTTTTVLQGDGCSALILKELALLRAKVDEISKTQFQNHTSVMKGLEKVEVNVDGGAAGKLEVSMNARAKRSTPPIDEDKPSTIESQPLVQFEDADDDWDAHIHCDFFSTIQKKEELLRVFKLYESHQAKQAADAEIRGRGGLEYMHHMWNTMNLEQWEIVINTVMGFVIAANALFIGFAIDFDDDTVSSPYVFMNLFFLVVFIIEFVVLVRLRGLPLHFWGPSKWSNIFDITLVVIDGIQLLTRLGIPNLHKEVEGAPAASLARIMRLAKLARLLRLLRADVFTDLLSMIQGMLGGMTTLFWAMALFLLVVYVCSLFFREFLGSTEGVDFVSEYFDSVPRSMFTTFRCSFGDCNSVTGQPIFEFVHSRYGYFYTIFYCLFQFCCVVGLFNVISAIFVESTMVAAANMESQKKMGRLTNDLRWATAITTLVHRLVDLAERGGYAELKIVTCSCGNAFMPDSNFCRRCGSKRPEEVDCECRKSYAACAGRVMSEAIEAVAGLWVPGALIDQLVKDPAAEKALADLDIDSNDNQYLSDILDPTNDGRISVLDLMDGLRRLRGHPRRSDIVTVDLMLRSIQQNVDETFNLVTRQNKKMASVHKTVQKDKIEKAKSSPTFRNQAIGLGDLNRVSEGDA